MADLIMINPSSGDNSAALMTGPDASDEILESVSKGTMLKMIGSSGNYYIAEYDNGMENIAHGGTGMTGTVVAYPYCVMYNDDKKTKKIANVNNGTSCTITDDSNPGMIKIKAFTTEGWNDGYVEAKYIYRDIEETPTPMRMRAKSVSTFAAKSTMTGTVNSSNGIKTRTGPGTSYQSVGAFNNNAKLTIYETKNGWYKVSGSSGWGQLTNVWVSASYVRVSGTNSTAAVSKSDATPVSTTKNTTNDNLTSDGDNWQAYSTHMTYFSNYAGNVLDYTANDEYYRQLADKYAFALGAPPKYNMDIDIQYIDELTAGRGRVTNKTLLSNPAILSICPGKVAMFPNLIGSEKDSVVEAMLSAAGGNNQLKDKIRSDAPGRFSGRLYKFEADTAEYSKYVNALCRACAIMLGIGDEMMPNTSTKLKNFDYTYWSIRKKYNPAAAVSSDNDKSLFRKFWSGLVKTGSRVVSTAVDDTTYINFFLNGNETTITETVNNDVTDSPLAGALESVSTVAAQINYFTGSGFDIGGTDVDDAINSLIDDGTGIVSGFKEIAENFLKGGKMVLPQMVEGSKYGKSISCNMKFMSPYGNKYSVFLKCLVPICHIIPMAYPRQLSDNMYTFPFLIRCAQTGHFNVDLGIITSLTINRGGSDETSWTVDTLATEWEVQMEITPLVDELMISSTSHPVLMCKNEMLLDYLSNFCGFDMLANNLGTKFDMMNAFIANTFKGVPHSIENKISDTLYNKLNSYFRLRW